MSGDTATIDIYDLIDAWGVSASKITAALKGQSPKNIVVNINSPGGDVFEGIAIYNLLLKHSAKVTTRVVGLAASAASVIAMAGDEIEIADNAFLMIHNAWTVAVGNANDLAETIKVLNKIDNALVKTYAGVTGIDEKDLAEMMAAETWLSADEAVELGFASATIDNTDAEAKAVASARFDLTAFRHVPKALAAARNKPSKVSAPAKGNDLAVFLDAVKKLNACLQR